MAPDTAAPDGAPYRAAGEGVPMTPGSRAAVEFRRKELEFRTRVWNEAGAAMEREARLLFVAIVQQVAPEVMEITLTGEYNEDGELRLTVTDARADIVKVDVDVLCDVLDEADGFELALLDMVAGTGEDYLGEHTIDITEEGKLV